MTTTESIMRAVFVAVAGYVTTTALKHGSYLLAGIVALIGLAAFVLTLYRLKKDEASK